MHGAEVDRFNQAARDVRKSRSPSWMHLAANIAVADALNSFFAYRQRKGGRGEVLRIVRAVRLENDEALKSFSSTGALDLNPFEALHQHRDSFLFQ